MGTLVKIALTGAGIYLIYKWYKKMEKKEAEKK